MFGGPGPNLPLPRLASKEGREPGAPGNVKPLSELPTLGEEVLTEAFIAERNEEAVRLEYLFNFSFGNFLALASLTDVPQYLLKFGRH